MKHLPKQKLCQTPKARKNVFNEYNIWIIVKLVFIKFYEIPNAFFGAIGQYFPYSFYSYLQIIFQMYKKEVSWNIRILGKIKFHLIQ